MTKEEALQQAIIELRDGKESGFNTIYSYTYNYVFQRARLLMKSEEEALDVVQEVYIAVYRSVHTLEDSSKLYAWMGGITYNLAMRAYRKKREVLLDEEKDGIFENIELADIDFKPEEKTQSEATAAIIKEIIDGLPELQKAAVFAFYYDGMSVKDIAKQFDVSENTIKSRLNYARKYLKEAVEEKEKKEGYRLHSFGIPTLLLAFFLWGKDKTIQAAQVQGVYNGICTRLGVQQSAVCPMENGGQLQSDGINAPKTNMGGSATEATAATETATGGAASGVTTASGISTGIKVAIGIAVAALGIGAAAVVVHTVRQSNKTAIEETQPQLPEHDISDGDLDMEYEVLAETETATKEKQTGEEKKQTEADARQPEEEIQETEIESQESAEETALPEDSPILDPELISQETPSYTIETVTYEAAQGTFVYPQISGWDNTDMQNFWNEQWRMDESKVTEEDLDASFEVKTANANYLSVVIRSSFMGGMHPYMSEIAYNIDMRTGQKIMTEQAVDVSKCAALLQEPDSFQCNNEAVDAQYLIDYYTFDYEAADDTLTKLDKILHESVLKEYENINTSSWYITDGNLSLIIWVTHEAGDFVDVTFLK